MTNYVGQREQFLDNCRPQNEAQNETHCAEVFKMFFDDELVKLIMRETNTYTVQTYKPEVSFHCVPDCGTGNLSLQTKCMFHVGGKIQKPTLRSYFSKSFRVCTYLGGTLR
jgi:hypothetical protein